MQIKELGEFGVIDRLLEMVKHHRSRPDNASPFSFKLLVDAGDDTAAWRTGEATELLTTDTMVEGAHFSRDTTPWRDLGWKSLASNISDIASMGGLPLFALVTLGLPLDSEMEDLTQLYGGLLEISNKYGVRIVGGDLVRSPVVFITVSLTGVHPGQPMLRSTARPGDQVAVTGYVGSSAGGLRLLLDPATPLFKKEPPRPSVGQVRMGSSGRWGTVTMAAADYLRQAHRCPEPAVAEGRLLCGAGVATAMDISDGLVGDLSKLSRASGVSARLFADRVPVHPLLKQAFPEDFLNLALNGGEDYRLLFTARKSLMEQVIPQLPPGAAIIGEVFQGETGRVIVVDGSGDEVEPGTAGWDHYRTDDC